MTFVLGVWGFSVNLAGKHVPSLSLSAERSGGGCSTFLQEKHPTSPSVAVALSLRQSCYVKRLSSQVANVGSGPGEAGERSAGWSRRGQLMGEEPAAGGGGVSWLWEGPSGLGAGPTQLVGDGQAWEG